MRRIIDLPMYICVGRELGYEKVSVDYNCALTGKSEDAGMITNLISFFFFRTCLDMQFSRFHLVTPMLFFFFFQSMLLLYITSCNRHFCF